jgi:chromosome segregation ATPase
MANPKLNDAGDLSDPQHLRKYLQALEDEVADLREEKRGIKHALKQALAELDEFREEKREFKAWLQQGDRKQKLLSL